MSIITLTTDFGERDWFVGTMKGVIANINPRAQVVDITHGIGPGDIRAGAFALMASYRYFPAKTIHVAVVDPGVGSNRAALVIETTRFTFVGPDNGVLSWATGLEKIRSIRSIENRKLCLDQISATFHGRDIFAPIAAHLSKGIKTLSVGPKKAEIEQLPWPRVDYRDGVVHGQVIYIDHFGNAITNIDAGELKRFAGSNIRTSIGKICIEGRSDCYANAAAGKAVWDPLESTCRHASLSIL